MRRQDIQLLASARQGDMAARCEAGRRYLLGVDGFPHHPSVGLEYLTHPSLADSELAARLIAEALPLHELVRLDRLGTLKSAARSGSVAAQLKLGVWCTLTCEDGAEAAIWFDRAASLGSVNARAALHATWQPHGNLGVAVLRALAGEPGIDAIPLISLALATALESDRPDWIARILECALLIPSPGTADLADAVCAGLAHVQSFQEFQLAAHGERVEGLLEDCIRRGSPSAALLLGRALCGIDTAALPASRLAVRKNLRRGAALLLRAADAGMNEAWMILYKIHADNHASVANPQMARFFLEKAALSGDVVAQRRLGALILRSATSLRESEQGIQWLHQAARMQDTHAGLLLQSLVLPVSGSETEATFAIDAVRQKDPWLACRLRTARDFGLTKLEAMSVDIVAGCRPWGLVVGPNPFITLAKLAAPRAIPALTPQVIDNLRRSVAFLEQARRDGAQIEGDRRRRTHRLRYWLKHAGFDETLFFAQARSTTLNTLRQGTRWAFHVRQPLRMALAA